LALLAQLVGAACLITAAALIAPIAGLVVAGLLLITGGAVYEAVNS
jgi:hypothetical protein